MNKEFVMQIIKIMAHRGYTAKDLAEKMNRPQKYVNAILSERKPITMRILAEITHACGCTFQIVSTGNTVTAA